jgi:hypothetical protein
MMSGTEMRRGRRGGDVDEGGKLELRAEKTSRWRSGVATRLEGVELIRSRGS